MCALHKACKELSDTIVIHSADRTYDAALRLHTCYNTCKITNLVGCICNCVYIVLLVCLYVRSQSKFRNLISG